MAPFPRVAIAFFVAGSSLLLPAPVGRKESVVQTFVVRANVHGWRGPACWAEKGEPLTVKPRGTWKIGRGNVPSIGPSGYEKKLGNFNYGALVMQIGCHTDDLSKKPNARRPPVVVERHSVGGVVTVVPKYGGVVYFYVNDRTPADNAGTIDVAIEGGRLAPVVGYHSPLLGAQWPGSLDSLDAPWGEFQGDYIVLTLPTEEMRKVKDPVKLMKWWDQLYLHYCELDGRRPSQEKTRFVPDVDILVGGMHAGTTGSGIHLTVATERHSGRCPCESSCGQCAVASGYCAGRSGPCPSSPAGLPAGGAPERWS